MDRLSSTLSKSSFPTTTLTTSKASELLEVNPTWNPHQLWAATKYSLLLVMEQLPNRKSHHLLRHSPLKRTNQWVRLSMLVTGEDWTICPQLMLKLTSKSWIICYSQKSPWNAKSLRYLKFFTIQWTDALWRKKDESLMFSRTKPKKPNCWTDWKFGAVLTLRSKRN